MADTSTNEEAITSTDTQSETSHWCEFTKTWPYPEICITCGDEAPELYDSDTSSSDNVDETTTTDPVINEPSKVKQVYAAVRSTPFIEEASMDETKTTDPVIEEPSKDKQVYAAVRSTPFIGEASKKVKVVKSKKPKKVTKKAGEINDFYKKLFRDYPLFLPASPPFSDGQINEFQCQHCGIHKELDDETWLPSTDLSLTKYA